MNIITNVLEHISPINNRDIHMSSMFQHDNVNHDIVVIINLWLSITSRLELRVTDNNPNAIDRSDINENIHEMISKQIENK